VNTVTETEPKISTNAARLTEAVFRPSAPALGCIAADGVASVSLQPPESGHFLTETDVFISNKMLFQSSLFQFPLYGLVPSGLLQKDVDQKQGYDQKEPKIA
jgi:hypothetical protein